MSNTISPRKRLLESVCDTPAAKRGRGRPRMAEKDLKTPRKDPNAPKRPRGHPRKEPNVPYLPPKISPSSKLENPRACLRTPPATPKDPRVPLLEQTTPHNLKSSIDDNSYIATPIVSIPGSSRELEATSNGVATPTSPEVTTKLKNKSGPTLEDITGRYSITFRRTEDGWPDSCKKMSLDISAFPRSKSVLVASFDLSIFEGTMLLAADKQILERIFIDEFQEKDIEEDDLSLPLLDNPFVYFAWSGRNIGVSKEVHTGWCGTQTGILEFKGPHFASFKGVWSLPFLGSNLTCLGEKTADTVLAKPEPLGKFAEEARRKANLGFWWRDRVSNWLRLLEGDSRWFSLQAKKS